MAKTWEKIIENIFKRLDEICPHSFMSKNKTYQRDCHLCQMVLERDTKAQAETTWKARDDEVAALKEESEARRVVLMMTVAKGEQLAQELKEAREATLKRVFEELDGHIETLHVQSEETGTSYSYGKAVGLAEFKSYLHGKLRGEVKDATE